MADSTEKSDTKGQAEATKKVEESAPEPEALQQAFRIDSLQALIEQTNLAFANARQKLQIYTRNLDPRILNNRKTEKILSQFVRSSRFARIEILITDEKNLQGIDHRLVSLSQAFSTYISIRLIPRDYHENYFAFYLIDGRQIIHRTLADRYESEYQQVPSSLLNQKAKYFNEIWQKASPASGLRALHL